MKTGIKTWKEEEMKYIGYYNGKIGDLNEMQIPMLDRVVFFGDGCYDATMFNHNRIFAEKDHFDRFYHSTELLRIPFPYSREELHDALQQCIDANELDHGMIYWQTSRGTGLRQHAFPREGRPNLLAMAVPLELVPFDTEYSLTSMEDQRFYYCNIKTLNLIPAVLAAEQAAEEGCQETVLYRNTYGRKRVTECAHSNILILKDGRLITPPRDNLILPGVTLKHLLMLAEQNGIPTAETPFTLEEVFEADEVIISSSGGLCTRACQLDGKPVGRKDPRNLKKLQDAYGAYYEKETSI